MTSNLILVCWSPEMSARSACRCNISVVGRKRGIFLPFTLGVCLIQDSCALSNGHPRQCVWKTERSPFQASRRHSENFERGEERLVAHDPSTQMCSVERVESLARSHSRDATRHIAVVLKRSALSRSRACLAPGSSSCFPHSR